MKYAYFGHHKCATQYIQQVILNLFKDKRIYKEFLTNNLPYDYHKIESYQNKWKNIKNKIIDFNFDFLIHVNANNEIYNAINKQFKGFHIIRDPRDILVSAYFSHLYSHSTSSPWMKIHRDKLKNIKSLEDGLLYELDNFTSIHLKKMWEWNYNRENIYESTFEKITTDNNEWVKILKFIGIPFDNKDLDLVLEKLSFKNKTSRNKGEEDQSHHLRKGIIGDWKNYFTPKIEDVFKERYGQMLIDLNYETPP